MLLLYSFATVGATVHMHYCMNRLTGISLIDTKQAVCNNCGMLKTKARGCCHDECKQIRLQADQLITTACEAPVQFALALPPQAVTYNHTINPLAITVEKVSHAPPNRQLQKLYIQHNVWRI